MSVQPLITGSGMHIAVSGMQVQELQFDAAANNIANDDTAGYATERVDLSPLPGGGVTATSQQLQPTTDPRTSSVDLGQQMADMMVSTTLYAANAKVVTVQGRMDDSLLDVLA